MNARHSFRFFTAALALSGSALTFAQTPNKLDRDGDGNVSRAEFDGSDAAFATLDLNKDGKLDAHELRGPGGTSPKSERTPRTRTEVPAAIKAETDIVYKTVDGQSVGLDLYRAHGRDYKKAPLVVWIHGGGYVKGSKNGAVRGNADVLVPLMMEHGYLVASLDYRLCSVGGPNITDCYADCKDALRFLVKNAEKYGIDPTRIVTVGASAGGGLSLMLAYSHADELPGDPALAEVPARVNVAVSWFGVTDFSHKPAEFNQGDEKRLVLFQSEKREAESNLISPVWYMNQREEKIPTLLVHGDQDPVVPFSQSVWMKAEADRLGRPVEFIPIKNMRHSFQAAPGGEMSPALDAVWAATVKFILKNNSAPSS